MNKYQVTGKYTELVVREVVTDVMADTLDAAEAIAKTMTDAGVLLWCTTSTSPVGQTTFMARKLPA